MASADRLIEVFHEAKARPVGAERDLFLSNACQGDQELKEQVLSLLRAHDGAGDFLKHTQAIPSVTLLTEKPGDKIGRYKLLQKIGEGGCGVVYMAEQEEPVRRRVALKVIKLGMDTKSVIARFEAERQALALMDHPNIARVLDAGATDTGRPYFVMELVRGIRITDYCDQNNISTGERLKLFTQVCQAIQHAHQKGIIHRDIKPSNILVTISEPGSPGCPKVIDFGIAKATTGGRLTDKTVFTAFEQFIGTPAYMSPEQAMMTSLDIDTRTDIYALGVLLYELLTGTTPFDAKDLMSAGLDAMRRIIHEQEPKRPSTRLSTMLEADLATVAKHRHSEPAKLGPLLRGDLDWIVMKALEKDRTRRYETASGLAADVQRHLSNEPVTAGPPSRLYRFQKLAQRNKVAFAAAGGIAAALIVGLILSIYGLGKAEQQRHNAQASEKKAQDEASKSWQVARFLNDVLKSIALGRDAASLREILDKTAERVGIGLTNQPEVEAELRYTLGEIYFEMRDWDRAESMHRKALQLRRSSLGDDHPTTALSMSHLGCILLAEGKWAEAENILRDALRNQRGATDNHSADAAFSLNELSVALNHGPDRAEAERLLREALPLQRNRFGQDSPEVAATLEHLQEVLKFEGKLPEAESIGREALALRKKHPEDRLALAGSLETFANTLERQKKAVEAEPLYREALSIQRTLSGNEDAAVARRLVHLGRNLKLQGKLPESLAVLRDAADLEDPSAQNALSWTLATSADSRVRDGSNAVILAEKAVAATSRMAPHFLDTLAAAYAEAGDFEKATATQKEAMLLLKDGAAKQDHATRLKLYESKKTYHRSE